MRFALITIFNYFLGIFLLIIFSVAAYVFIVALSEVVSIIMINVTNSSFNFGDLNDGINYIR